MKVSPTSPELQSLVPKVSQAHGEWILGALQARLSARGWKPGAVRVRGLLAWERGDSPVTGWVRAAFDLFHRGPSQWGKAMDAVGLGLERTILLPERFVATDHSAALLVAVTIAAAHEDVAPNDLLFALLSAPPA